MDVPHPFPARSILLSLHPFLGFLSPLQIHFFLKLQRRGLADETSGDCSNRFRRARRLKQPSESPCQIGLSQSFVLSWPRLWAELRLHIEGRRFHCQRFALARRPCRPFHGIYFLRPTFDLVSIASCIKAKSGMVFNPEFTCRIKSKKQLY